MLALWFIREPQHTRRNCQFSAGPQRGFRAIVLWKSGAGTLFSVQFYLALVWFSPSPTCNVSITGGNYSFLRFCKELYKQYSKTVCWLPSLTLTHHEDPEQITLFGSFYRKSGGITVFHFVYKPIYRLNELGDSSSRL